MRELSKIHELIREEQRPSLVLSLIITQAGFQVPDSLSHLILIMVLQFRTENPAINCEIKKTLR